MVTVRKGIYHLLIFYKITLDVIFDQQFNASFANRIYFIQYNTASAINRTISGSSRKNCIRN